MHHVTPAVYQIKDHTPVYVHQPLNAGYTPHAATFPLEQEKTEQLRSQLKATQAMLLQREKTALLGELAAGIVHEIQNPVNYVNNFAELNNELLQEMLAELEKGNVDAAKGLVEAIQKNGEKIALYGKRVSSIVRNMLLQAGKPSTQKEPTNINALAAESLQLSYHSLLAKDKSFRVTMRTCFDEKLGNVNVVPQDLSRVLLNLFTNAFYAVRKKWQQADKGYEPLVSVSTKRIGNTVEIRVQDNGTGIPQHLLNKIFQAFFTTKPSGEGTGLGLSLCCDIITNGHGGKIYVQSAEGIGTEFTVQLPLI